MQRGAEADALLARALGDDLLEAGESTGDDEQHVGRVDLDELLVRMLAAALRGNGGDRALENLQQRLLHALARDVAGDRRVLGLAGDLVDLVDVDDAGLGALDVVVRGLDELEQDVLDVFTDVAGLGEGRGIRYRERHVEALGEGLGEIGLAAAGRADQQDVRLRDLDVVDDRIGRGDGVAGAHALVVVVDRDRQRPLRGFLADDVLLEEGVDLARLRQLELARGLLAGLGEALLDDLVAQLDALVADVHAGSGDELLHLLLALAAEGTLEQVGALPDSGHQRAPFSQRLPLPSLTRAQDSVMHDGGILRAARRVFASRNPNRPALRTKAVDLGLWMKRTGTE